MKKIKAIALDILTNKDEIIEKFLCFDDNRDDFIKDVDYSKIPLLLVYILMELDEKKIKQKKSNVKNSTKETRKKIINIITRNGIIGASIPLIKNKLKNIEESEIENEIVEMVNQNMIIKKEVIPVRGPSTFKYFIRNDNFFKLSNE